MKSVALFVLFAATMLVALVFGEPVKYRESQRSRASAKQTVEIAPAEGSEDDEIEGKSEQTTRPNEPKAEKPLYFVVKPYLSGPLVVLPLDQPLDQSKGDSTTVESTTSEDDVLATTDANVNTGGPYSPSGWKPAGQLLLLPNEEIAVTTTVLPTTEQPTTQRQQKNQSGRLVAQQTEQEEIAFADNASEVTTPASDPKNAMNDVEKLETTEPKEQNANDKLKAENSSESADETPTTTEAQSTTTQQPSSKLETTSEPESEQVDVEQHPASVNGQGQSQSPAVGSAVPPFVPSGPGAFIIQLPDGSLQRFVFIAAPNGVLPNANLPPNALVPVATSPFQQLIQPQAEQPFGYNPIASPRVVTFSSQYQAF